MRTTLLVFLFIITSSKAQQLPFAKVIERLAKKHEVFFSYDPILVNELPSIRLPKGKTLDEKLKTIEQNVTVVFEKIDARNYAILYKESVASVAIENLDEVVIKSYITKGIRKKKNGTLAIALPKTGILPGVIEPDVLLTLQNIPGLQSPDETVNGLHIRGSTPDQNLILYDHVKMYGSAHFFGLLSVFNPYTIDEVSLFRSSTRAKYGGHAGGVISIGVDDQIPDKPKLGFSSTLTHASINTKIPVFKDKFAIIASARRGFTDIINSITFERKSELAFQNTAVLNDLVSSNNQDLDTKEDFFYEDYFSKIVFKPNPSLKFDFGILYNSNKLSFENQNNNSSLAFRDGLREENRSWYESVEFSNDKFGSHRLQLSETNFNKKFIGVNRFDPTIRQPTLLEITFEKGNFIDEVSFSYIGKKAFSKSISAEIGYERNRSTVGYEVENIGLNFTTSREFLIGSETSQAFFGEVQYKKESLFVNTGVRRQYFNRFNKVFWEPRFFVNYNISKKLWVNYAFEKKNQSISQITDLRNDGLGNLFDRIWVVSTENNVPILKSNQHTIGIDFQNKDWTINVEVYSKKLDGIGVLLNDDIFNPRNVTGKNTIKGLDFLVKKKWNQFSSWLSYSYSKSRFRFQEINNNQPFDGVFDRPHRLSWNNNWVFKKFEFALGYTFSSGIPFTEKELNFNRPESSFLSFGNFNERRLPNYSRIDFSGVYNFYLDKLKRIKARAGFNIQNTINEQNLLSRDFQVIEAFNNNDEEINIPTLKKIDRVSIRFTPNLFFRVEM